MILPLSCAWTPQDLAIVATSAMPRPPSADRLGCVFGGSLGAGVGDRDQHALVAGDDAEGQLGCPRGARRW